jgi:uncharacterized protein (DUF433 family)
VLTAQARGEVCRALRTQKPLPSRLEFGPIVVSTAGPVRKVRERMQRLHRARAAVDVDPEIRGGEPVVRGPRIPVQLLDELMKAGETPERILEGYPALNPRLISAGNRAQTRTSEPG